MKVKITIPFLTFAIGFFPMLVMSFLLNGFWITSPYDFPLVLIPAVLIGDSIILPILNYNIYRAIQKVLPLLKCGDIYKTAFFGVLLSSPINAYTHYVWSHGKYTGFMEPQYGVLSAAGWWHIVISVLQMAIIFLFAVIWSKTVKKQDQETFKTFEKAAYILIIFNLVNLSGIFINKTLVIHKRLMIDFSMPNILTSLLPPTLAVFFLYAMRKLHQSAVKLIFIRAKSL